MDEAKQQVLSTVSSFVGKLLRDHFGKGPESVFVSFGAKYFTIYLRNFISPMERVLMEQDQESVVRELRQKLMLKLIPELRTFLEITTGRQVTETYYDWSLHNRSGIICGIVNEAFWDEDELITEYEGHEELNRLIEEVSQQAQKRPRETYSCMLNSRTLVVVRSGILVRIEKEMVRLGHGNLLRTVKANLEKSFLHLNGGFEAILKQRIIDSFVDWDFEMDKSLIVFILQPKK